MIHDIVTSSPSDSEQLEATPFVTSISLGGPIDVPASILPPVVPEEPSFFPLSSEGPAAAERPVDSPSDTHSTPLGAAEASPARSGVGIAAETPAAPSAAPERTEPPNLAGDRPAPETVASEETEEGATGENEEMEVQDEVEDEEEDEEGTASIGPSLNSNVRETCGTGFQMLLTMEHVAS